MSQNLVANLVRDYNPFASDRELAQLLIDYSLDADLADACQARLIINRLAASDYQNEAIIKHALVKRSISRADETEVTFFEFPVGGNRVDLCRINGRSYAYEIKTEYDDYSRLKRQLASYSNVFDYVYVVVPLSSCQDVRLSIPKGVGLITYRYEAGEFKLAFKKRAESNETSIKHRLACLSAKDQKNVLKLMGAKREGRRSKQECESAIEQWAANHLEEFDELFRTALKIRYSERWSFLRENFDRVLPLDMQASFANRICISDY